MQRENLTIHQVRARFGVMMARTFDFAEVIDLVSGNADWLDSWLSVSEVDGP